MIIAVSLLLAPTDNRVIGPGSVSRILLLGRIGLATLSAVLLIVFRRSGNRDRSRLDRTLFLFGFCGTAFMIGLGATRPAFFFVGYLLTEICMLSVLYYLAPMPVPHKAVLGVLATSADAYLLVTRHWDFSWVLMAAVACAYLVTNVMGLLVSRNLCHLKREQFGIQLRLESALAAVKTLRGVLPICAHCKKIRNDEGLWEVIERYVRDRTHAEFSHDICPNCIERHYPGMLGQT